jgi:protein SCO1/2
MNRRQVLQLPFAAALGVIVRPAASFAEPTPRPERRASDRLPDVVLVNHRSEPVRFYRDLIEDHSVVINFMYVQCRGTCPGTSALLSHVWPALDRALGEKLRLVSITLDPEEDGPAQLAEYAAIYAPAEKLRSDWQFLTGAKGDIEQLRRALGYSDPDPRIDADPSQHASLLTFGNDRLNRWASLPVGIPETDLIRSVVRILRGFPRPAAA